MKRMLIPAATVMLALAITISTVQNADARRWRGAGWFAGGLAAGALLYGAHRHYGYYRPYYHYRPYYYHYRPYYYRPHYYYRPYYYHHRPYYYRRPWKGWW